MFHPEGLCYEGRFERLEGLAGGLAVLASMLEGPLLARFSSAWWRGGREWIDALGCALRFGWTRSQGAQVAPSNQDLLLATIRLPWTTPIAPFSTHVHDFMANSYFAVSPFEAPGVGRVKFRLVPFRAGRTNRARAARLDELVARHEAALSFEVRAAKVGAEWIPIGRLRLTDRVEFDEKALRFSPFLAGRGIKPLGFVHYLRPGAYWGSQTARRLTSGESRSSSAPARLAPGARSRRRRAS